MLMPARTLVNIICSVSSSLFDAGYSKLKAEGWSGLYANLCTQTKKYLDDKNTVPHARETLLKFYDELPMPKEYWDVTQDDFQQLKGRFRGERGARKRGNINGTVERVLLLFLVGMTPILTILTCDFF